MIEVMSALMGVNFRGKPVVERVKALTIGERLTLRAEPDNAYDPNAVQVWTVEGEPTFIGYVAKECNLELAEHLAEGGHADAEVISFLSATKPHLSIRIYEEGESANGPAEDD